MRESLVAETQDRRKRKRFALSCSTKLCSQLESEGSIDAVALDLSPSGAFLRTEGTALFKWMTIPFSLSSCRRVSLVNKTPSASRVQRLWPESIKRMRGLAYNLSRVWSNSKESQHQRCRESRDTRNLPIIWLVLPEHPWVASRKHIPAVFWSKNRTFFWQKRDFPICHWCNRRLIHFGPAESWGYRKRNSGGESYRNKEEKVPYSAWYGHHRSFSRLRHRAI